MNQKDVEDYVLYVWLKDELLWNEFALNEGSVDERAAALRRAIFRAAVVDKAMPGFSTQQKTSNL